MNDVDKFNNQLESTAPTHLDIVVHWLGDSGPTHWYYSWWIGLADQASSLKLFY